ncbi:hypothetical protein SODALDRAFT_335016 [Sodiomyces alkalinus F11]|uniref:Extracellular membrane protein CFEM domain-containing protein n=1 Tax=Sodiomyces alkalinus (strain CBS 110278 / VKM F-3762 / F11) TaxID=1314773 RepID=A0A3N2PR36_SODAK|nr:hypothetical protein SODALDRAFT_335016 [Sodiomyces alkalinus F11]ROT36816.1 hypothetical protein SODALDRAFT_335016 [Sodiomyces alkalinus F11]
MRFHTAALLAGVFALAQAQGSDTPDNSGISIPTPTGVDPATSSIAARINACLSECDAADVTCQAACVAVPAPNASQVVALNNCAAECDQGSGSPADTEAYAQCVSMCVTEHFFSDGVVTPQPTNAAGNNDDDDDETDATGTGTGASPTQTGTDASGDAQGSGSPTSDADAAQETGDDGDSAAPHLVGSVSLAFVGLAAAFFL